MIAGVIALSIALAAAVGGLIALALKAIGAERRCGDARTDEAGMAERLLSMTKQRDDLATRVDEERTRADALDNALAQAALDNAGPVDGAFARLLQTWARSRAKGGDGKPAVPDSKGDSRPAPGPGDELLPLE